MFQEEVPSKGKWWTTLKDPKVDDSDGEYHGNIKLHVEDME